MRKIKKVLILSIFIVVCGASVCRYLYINKYLIKADKLGTIISYFYILSESDGNPNIDEYYSRILKAFNVTPNQFKLSIKYYSNKLKKLQTIHKSALDELLFLQAKY